MAKMPATTNRRRCWQELSQMKWKMNTQQRQRHKWTKTSLLHPKIFVACFYAIFSVIFYIFCFVTVVWCGQLWSHCGSIIVSLWSSSLAYGQTSTSFIIVTVSLLATDLTKLEVFQMSCLHRILGVTRHD